MTVCNSFSEIKKKKEEEEEEESFIAVKLKKAEKGKYIRDSKGSATAKCFRKLHT